MAAYLRFPTRIIGHSSIGINADGTGEAFKV
jgi:hypothetical protein